MPRRVNRKLDIERTELLDLNELYVQQGEGDKEHFVAWLQEPEVADCPLCGCTDLKVQDLFSKNYWDIIRCLDQRLCIQLLFKFYKYRCLNADCRHIFAKDIRFASQFGKTTYRLEDEIAQNVIQGLSYSEIAKQYPAGVLTKVAVGQIFNRWVHKQEELRRMQSPPSSLCIISGKLDGDQNYTLFINLDDGIRVFDILYGVDSMEIAAKIRSIGVSSIDTILTDCDPIINNVIIDNLPKSTYLIPLDFWLRLVKEEFGFYARQLLRYRQEPHKLDLIMQPEEELRELNTRNTLLANRKELKQPYRDYQELLHLISNQEEPWTYAMLDNWMFSICDELKQELPVSEASLKTYREAIYHYELCRDAAPQGLCVKTEILKELLFTDKIFSEEQLKAKVLYSTPSDAENWRGIPIDDVISKLREIQNRNKQEESTYEYQRR